MADNPLKQTAEQLRNAVAQAKDRGELGTRRAPAATPEMDPAALAAAVEAQLGPALAAVVRAELSEKVDGMVNEAVTKAFAENPPASTTLDPELVRRVEAASERIGAVEDDSEVMMHLRNVLPGQMRQEINAQNQALMQRVTGLEGQIDAMRGRVRWGLEIIRILVIALIVALIALGVTIFDRQIQNWGRDVVYPVFGVSIKQAPPSAPRPAIQSTPAQAREAQ